MTHIHEVLETNEFYPNSLLENDTKGHGALLPSPTVPLEINHSCMSGSKGEKRNISQLFVFLPLLLLKATNVDLFCTLYMATT